MICIKIAQRTKLTLVAVVCSLAVACTTPSKNGSSISTDVSENEGDRTIASSSGEYVIPGEAQAIDDLKELFTQHFAKFYQSTEVEARRAVHAKPHGCAQAQVEILPGIDPELRFGVFSEPRTFDAWVRFSNGDGPVGPDDAKGVSQGMGIKLLGVKGPKILHEPDRFTQDFLLANQPAFFVKDVTEYRDAIRAREGGILTKLMFARHYRAQLRYRDSAPLMASPLTGFYWSKTAYLLGHHAVKFRARPCDGRFVKAPKKPADDFLHDALRDSLASSEACFYLSVQKRVLDGNEETQMPIEDASVEWSESASPFKDVARITMPPHQDIDDPAREQLCENLSFNPWDTLKEQRPIGSLNRVRKAVYELSSGSRHSHNGVRLEEPQSTHD